MEDFDTEISGSRAELADVLSGVADGLRAGSVSLGEGEETVTVKLPPELDLEVELETEAGEHSLELELEWPASEKPDATADDSGTSVPESTDVDQSDHSRTDDSDASDTAIDRSTDSHEEAIPADTATESDPPASTVVDVPGGRRSLARFELFRDRGSEWRWRLRHRNGNIIATSGEGYTQKHNAWKGLRSVVANAPEAEVTDEPS